jgi:N-methylhydantoinase B
MKLDPVTLEILGNKVSAITEEMCFTLQRTGRTLYVKETADFCCALAGLDGRFFAYPRSIGVSGFVGLECGPALEAVGPLEPGDVILTNDPYRSGGLATHLPDLHLIKPYFHEGRIIAYGWAFVHCSDIGGRVPSSISPTNHEIFQEGLQIPPVRLVRGGRMNADVELLFRANSRTPDANMGDIHAMLAALSTGERRVAQIVTQHGAEAVLAAETDLVDYAADRARAVLAGLDQGEFRFADYLDDDAVSDLPVRLAVAIRLAEGGIHIDFTGTDPQVAAAMNVPSLGRPHAWLTLRVLALVSTLDPTVPMNAGLLHPITITAPEGSLINPQQPAAVGVRHAAAIRVNDVLNGALGLAAPSILPAAASGMVVPLVFAEPTEAGGQAVQVIEPMIGGTGGRQGHDGIDGRDSGISNLANNPVETVEAEVGVEILRYGLRPDSGGPGEWRGGCGLEIRFRVRAESGTVLARGLERVRFQPWGTQGGSPGRPAEFILNEGTPHAQRLSKVDLLPVRRGDVVTLRTAGAGGYGDPFRRNSESVLQDVMRGLVSAIAARTDYGVAIADGAIDAAETDRLRAEERPERPRLQAGLVRAAWEQIFEPVTVDGLANDLLRLPAAMRQRERSRIYRQVLEILPEGFTGTKPNQDSIEAARQRFAASAAALKLRIKTGGTA